MLTICVGPNGSGKSLWAMHQLARCLMADKRIIVTSLSVDLARLNDYMQRLHGSDAPDVCSRVVRIDREQMRSFWRVRGWGPYSEYGREPLLMGAFGDESWRVPFQEVGAVVYILDEIQTVFGARDWAKTGPEFVSYQSQHRKFGDDVIAIAPASSLIDKQFRLLCGECVALQNLYQARVGLWKAPRKIVYHLYQNCPPVVGEDAFAKGSFQIDVAGLASCYRTQEGLGIVGKAADIGRESKGVAWWWIFPLAVAAGLVAWFGCSRLLGWGVSRGVRAMKIGSVGTNALAQRVVSGVMPGFGSVGGGLRVVGRGERGQALVDRDRDRVERPECVGFGECRRGAGRVACVQMRGGWVVWGSNVVNRGDVVVLDGREFRRVEVEGPGRGAGGLVRR